MSETLSSTHGRTISVNNLAKVDHVDFSETLMMVTLSDGRVISTPIKWYPRLANASHAVRMNWEPCGAGYGIHWPDVDEDLSVEGMLCGRPSVEYKPN